jgi:hypothetical protein
MATIGGVATAITNIPPANMPSSGRAIAIDRAIDRIAGTAFDGSSFDVGDLTDTILHLKPRSLRGLVILPVPNSS